MAICLAVTTATACLWDSDTLRQEAAGAPGLLDVLVGRFDRFPDTYYARRLEIAAERIEANGDDLLSYDNAAVACDRLGRPSEAIEWMARKRAALDVQASSGEADAEHEYRYLANLGTFHAHRWLKDGADREDLSDLERARDLIADAIALNPDAHFGRETYQLLAIEWLLEAPEPKESKLPSLFDAAPPESLSSGTVRYPRPDGIYGDAVEGLSGLIRLGAAWESVDVHAALLRALYPTGDSSLAMVARLRTQELLHNGNRSLSEAWHVPEPRQWHSQLYASTEQGMARDEEEIAAWYAEARDEADRWREARNAYVLAKLDAGEHPDTHAAFWAGWEAPHDMPEPPTGVLGLPVETAGDFLTIGLLALIFIAGPIVVYRRLRRWSRRGAQPA